MKRQMLKYIVIVAGCSDGKKGAITYTKSMNCKQMTTKTEKKKTTIGIHYCFTPSFLSKFV